MTRHLSALWNGLIDTFPIFFEFLTPHDLLRFVSMHRDLAKLATYDVVTWIASMNGNVRTNKTLRYLLELTLVGSIYLPSPLRVLRLVCVKRCERCNVRTLHNLPRLYGLAHCWECTIELTERVNTMVHRYHSHCVEWHDVMIHPRVLSRMIQNQSSESFYFRRDRYCMLKETYYTPFGEPVGPLVTSTHATMFVKTFRSFRDIDKFIKENLHAPSLSSYDELNDLIARSRSNFFALDEQRHEGRIRGKALYRRRNYFAVQKMLAKLSPKLNRRMKRILMYRRVDHRFFLFRGAPAESHRRIRCLIFANRFVHRTLSLALRAPMQTMNNTSTLNELAQTLNAYPSYEPEVNHLSYRFWNWSHVPKSEWDWFHDIVNDDDNVDYGFLDSPIDRFQPLRRRVWAFSYHYL